MQRFLPRSIAARTLAALLMGFATLLVATVCIHDLLLRHAVGWSTEELLAQRLATVVKALAATPHTSRAEAIEALSGPDLIITTGTCASAPHMRSPSDATERMSSRTRELVPASLEVHVWAERSDPRTSHLIGLEATTRLPDGTWLDVKVSTVDLLSSELRLFYAYAGTFGIALLVGIGFAARAVAKPVASLAAVVSQLDVARAEPNLPVSGPREVRQLSQALNGMAARTREVIRQRTLALGALSHDLMSPIARMRLRAEDLPDRLRESTCRDLSEMETMIGDVLAYLRGGQGGEVAQAVSIAALVRTVISEFADAGHLVEEGLIDNSAVAHVRRVAAKRAITNLVGNAVRYGRDPWIDVVQEVESVVIHVGDRGSGISDEDLPHVTEPFFRGDRARSAGGGSGLGLATVRAVVEDHGGTLAISSKVGHGTVVTVRWPRDCQEIRFGSIR
ncbi:ATP-binding protein [Muricoccus radiodurans]|uniref:ATP-binding protein n=1 Tax=Muricoccus radiodurans TaxID=2231721 RepID=UPI003CEABEFD